MAVVGMSHWLVNIYGIYYISWTYSTTVIRKAREAGFPFHSLAPNLPCLPSLLVHLLRDANMGHLVTTPIGAARLEGAKYRSFPEVIALLGPSSSTIPPPPHTINNRRGGQLTFLGKLRYLESYGPLSLGRHRVRCCGQSGREQSYAVHVHTTMADIGLIRTLNPIRHTPWLLVRTFHMMAIFKRRDAG